MSTIKIDFDRSCHVVKTKVWDAEEGTWLMEYHKDGIKNTDGSDKSFFVEYHPGSSSVVFEKLLAGQSAFIVKDGVNLEGFQNVAYFGNDGEDLVRIGENVRLRNDGSGNLDIFTMKTEIKDGQLVHQDDGSDDKVVLGPNLSASFGRIFTGSGSDEVAIGRNVRFFDGVYQPAENAKSEIGKLVIKMGADFEDSGDNKLVIDEGFRAGGLVAYGGGARDLFAFLGGKVHFFADVQMGAGENVFVTSNFSADKDVGPNGEPGVIEAYAGRWDEQNDRPIMYDALSISYHQLAGGMAAAEISGFGIDRRTNLTGTQAGGRYTGINTYLDAANNLLGTFHLKPETEGEGAKP